jgi:alkaline phosphatase D
MNRATGEHAVAAAQHFLTHRPFSRRQWLAHVAALEAIPLLGRASFALERPGFAADPFTLGVASGDPDDTSVVLWTRLAPRPLEPDGGMPREAVNVVWEVASDESLRRIVASGTATATPALGHSVHVEVPGLAPDRWYWYRFRAGDAVSPIGRTRTFPPAGALPDRLRFAVTSCQNYEQGLYTAYAQMAQDDLDLVCHLGDYIYESAAGRKGKVRTHVGPELESLDDYRIRHAQYRADPLLHGMHAVCPWIVTWDDHEVANNYAGAIPEKVGVDPVAFLEQRANAYQAYYESLPLRATSRPRGPDMRLYRRARFGELADFLVLDTRQYRDDQPNDDRRSTLNAEALDPARTLLGRRQKSWLCGELVRSTARWNVLAQQVMMGLVGRRTGSAEFGYSMDQWPGYAAERAALLRFVRDRRIANPVVLTGDIHSNWVNELRVDDRNPEEPVVATEFVATSLSSGGNGLERPKSLDQILADNPGVRFHNGERGYIRCVVTPQEWRSDFMVVDDVERPGGTTFARTAFVVTAGDPRVAPA